MKKRFIFAFIFLLIFAFSIDAQLTEEKQKVFEQFVARTMKAEKIPGLTIGFIKDGKKWVKGYGFADLENKVPAKAESAYRLASITKPMTAIAILQLVEQGKINLTDEVQKYVPYFPKKNYPVRIGLLLGHLGGISHYRNYDLEGHFKNHKNTRAAIRVFESFDLVAKPGTRYNYTSYGYNLLGAVIEGASGKSYAEYMRENVWKPLEMNATMMDNPNNIIPNRVKGYRLINGRLANSEFVDISSRFSAGGTRSTVIDLLKFADGMSRGKLLREETRRKMWNSMATDQGRYTYYGMGWRTDSENGHFMVSHSGSQAETNTILYVFPTHNLAIAAAMNFENSNPQGIAQKLFELITEKPWSIAIYNKNRADLVPLKAMDMSFRYGMQHFDRFGKPITTDVNELIKAFEFFNNSLKLPEKDALIASRKGINPAGNLLLIKMASFMAWSLKENGLEKDFDKYFQNGAIYFFNDYINWYQKNRKHVSQLKFEKDFEQKVKNWNSDWSKVWNKETRGFQILESTNLKEIENRFEEAFSESSVIPNYVNEIEVLIGNSVRKGNITKAFEVAKFGVTLYPQSDSTNGSLGLLHLLFGNKKESMNLLKKSLEADPEGFSSARNLNSIAYELAGINQWKMGLVLLQATVSLHPKEANLYDSIGDFYVNLKQKEKAIEYYSKALKIDPNYPNASNARKILAKLKEKK